MKGDEEMVKPTFVNLPQDKKEKITQALLNEFSNHPLAEAQVARIVKEAEIARGAFYKYFEDLSDAYEYLYQLAMKEIHSFVKAPADYQPEIFYQNVVDFINQTQGSKYAKLVKMHMLYNESTVSEPFSQEVLVKLSPQNWSAMVLSHAAIREILVDLAQKELVFSKLKAGLTLLKKESD